MSAAAPATDARSGRTAWIAGAALAAAAAVVHASAHPAALLGSLADEALLVALARTPAFGDTFAPDVWMRDAAQVFSRVYSWVLSPFVAAAGDPVVALRVLALPVHAVFLAGTFRVAERVAAGPRARAAGWAAAVACAALPIAFAAAHDTATGPPLSAGSALPRDLVFALLPWIWLVHDALPEGISPRRAALFAVVGLLANVHPLTAIHVAGLLAADLVVRRPSVASLASAAAGLGVAAAGASPYVVQYAGRPLTPGDVPQELLLWRVEGIGADTLTFWAERTEAPLWLALAWGALRGADPSASSRPLGRLLLVALGLAMASPLADAVVPGFQLGRLGRVTVWAAAVLLATAAAGGAFRRAPARAAVAAAVVAVCVLGPLAVAALRGYRRGPLESLARAIEVRVADGPTSLPDLGLPDRDRPSDPARPGGDADAFRDVCRAAREASGDGDLFLVPPEDFGAFRAYAGRGAWVTRKEGGFALSFLGGRGRDWFERYAATAHAYADPDPGALGRLAAAAGASFAILDTPRDAPDGWAEVHRAGPYRLFRTRLE